MIGAAIDANDVISQYRPMIRRIVTRIGRRAGLQAWEIDEVDSRALSHVTMHSLPRFDPERGSLEQFIAVCAASVARKLTKRQARARAAPGLTLDPESIEQDARQAITIDRITEDRIEMVADAIARSPETLKGILTRHQIAILAAVIAAPPEMTRCELASRLGYNQPTSLHHILARIENRIRTAAPQLLAGVSDSKRPHQGRRRRTCDSHAT